MRPNFPGALSRVLKVCDISWGSKSTFAWLWHREAMGTVTSWKSRLNIWQKAIKQCWWTWAWGHCEVCHGSRNGGGKPELLSVGAALWVSVLLADAHPVLHSCVLPPSSLSLDAAVCCLWWLLSQQRREEQEGGCYEGVRHLWECTGFLVTWLFSPAAAPLTRSQPNKGSVYPDGALGSDLHSVIPPEKTGLRLHFHLLAWSNEICGLPNLLTFLKGQGWEPVSET